MTDRDKAEMLDDIIRRFGARTASTLSAPAMAPAFLTVEFTSRGAARELLDALTAAETVCR